MTRCQGYAGYWRKSTANVVQACLISGKDKSVDCRAYGLTL
jgi:hypothetical protein